ncbi:MAG: 4-hydroxybutyrate CoA-transferase [Alicyclobacillus herbarius]|uniref:acetyl-CoA hydrolase/transferase family protein n=1 Tax=Alicyclobacillus herbarius TaxID=122960 RepID=UPI002355F207|nr:acetyl-CoA hydrolase/transferase C-terminal domain-containing protein [Alicyclobacillus herbarius]MCL6632514.1 4-hydroxybutyrate CoA-transferase [Alicyclobacillus herbarius]
MNFYTEYQSKRLTAEEAVRFIEPGDHIVTPINPGEPPALLNALRSHPQLSSNWLYRMLPGYPVLDVEVDRLQQVSIFLSGQDRLRFQQGQIDLLPNHFSDIPYLLKQRSNHPVIMAAVSPMDENGYFSLGTSVSYVGFLLQEAKKIILEVNVNMPRTFGEQNNIHISRVTGLIENHVKLPTAPNPVLSEKDFKIGQTIADIIQNGDTLQIGFGAMPNAAMEFLKDHRDLGIDTEMLPDKIIDLYESGAISNQNKPFYKGKTTATFAFGTQRLYDFMNENEDILMLPCNVSNDLRRIAQINNLVSVNSAIEVDFLGQCNSEMVNGKYYSSTGGQSDFAKGVRLAQNGRGIICLYSTAKNDTITKIVPTLCPGAAVTTSKNDVDIIVTEYGKAELKGKTVQERTEALINIAHPKFREQLTFDAIKMGYLPRKNFYMVN